MRTHTLLAGMLLIGTLGCAGLPTIDEISSKTNLISDRIVVIATANPPGGSATQYHFLIEKDAKSMGTLFFGESNFEEGRTTLYELPSNVHAECLAKLEDVRFFDMNPNEPSWVNSDRHRHSSIEVHYRGRKHVVKEFRNTNV